MEKIFFSCKNKVTTMQKGFGIIGIIVVVAIVAIAGAAWYTLDNWKPDTGGLEDDVVVGVCPQDLMQCPDGSYVSRTGPNCEFAECAKPSITQVDTSDWGTFKHVRFTLKYRPDMTVGSNNMGSEPEEASSVSVSTPDGSEVLAISETQLPSLKDAPFNPEHEDPGLAKKWDIKTLSEKIWELNGKYIGENNPYIEKHSMTNLEKTHIAGREAYMFLVIGGYTDYAEKGLIDNETVYLFVADGDGIPYRISYRSSNSELARSILQSLQFSK